MDIKIRTGLTRLKVVKFDCFSKAKNITDLGYIDDSTCTLYKYGEEYIAVDPFDLCMFTVSNKEEAKSAYQALRIKNFIEKTTNIVMLICNIALFIKILKKKGWIK